MRALAAFLLFVVLFTATAKAEEMTEEQKYQAVQSQLKENKQQLQKTKAEEQAVLGHLVVITKELSKTKTKLFLAQKKISANEVQIGTLTYELSKIEADLKGKERKLRGRIREIYKGSGQDFLQLVFTSRSMADFFNRLYYFGKILSFDSDLVREVKTDANKAKVKREVLVDKTREIKGLAVEIEAHKNEVAAQAEEKKKTYDELKHRREDFETKIAELEKSSKELEAMILKKMAERRGSKVHGTGLLAWPLQGRITSTFGWRRNPFWGGRNFHTGLDIAAPYGSPIKSADAGEVIFAGWWDGYGKAVVIDHGKNTTTVYAHMSRIYEQVGSVVAKGQVIGLVGSTGYSTGPHLHFEVRKNGKPMNPKGFL